MDRVSCCAWGAILAGWVFGCAGSSQDARAASEINASTPTVLTLSPYAGTDLRTTQLSVGGAAPAPFIVDTGAGKTVITPEEVSSAGCAPFGRLTGNRADGAPVSMSRCGPVTLGFDGLRLPHEVGVFDLMSLMHGAPPIGGLVGLDAFEGRAVTLDWAHEQVVIETPESLAARVKTMTPIDARVTLEPSGAMVIFLPVKTAAGPLWLELDTGNDGPVFLAPHALAQLGLDLPKGAMRAASLEVPGLGSFPVKVKSRAMVYDGQLNPAFARQLVLTVDLASRRVWARRNDPVAAPARPL